MATEGEKTERDYLALLNTHYGEREGRKFRLKHCNAGRGLRPTETVDHVIASSVSPDDEKWALFDRDSEDQRDDDIPEAMRKAAAAGVQVALSHPSFELWLLLHFQQFSSQEDGRTSTVLDRLRTHRDAKGFQDYDKQSGDRGKGLGGQRGESLVGKENVAVRNARKLVSLCPFGDCSPKNADFSPIPGPRAETPQVWRLRSGHGASCDPLKRDPSSDVWRLLATLGIGTEDRREENRTSGGAPFAD
ncbi:RloB family protein [Streptomyces chumphonensis]|uniref:RloB family protein n=1 Tax=Streptomyces chumphonensis TaxID=1214925 RepID=UPI003D731BA4